MTWDDKTVARLTADWTRGKLTASEIATKLGTTRNAVLGKLNRLGLVGHATKEQFRNKTSRGLCQYWDDPDRSDVHRAAISRGQLRRWRREAA